MVITISNQKGGVAKTTTSINLAGGLAVEGYKVLLIDADPQTNTTQVFIHPNTEIEVEKSLYNVVMRFAPLASVIRETRTPNLHFVPCHIRLSSADLELAAAIDNRSARLKRAVDEIKDKYDYVIIDTPPSLGLVTINAFVASDRLIIPVAPEFFSLKGLEQLQETVLMVQQSLNPDLKILGVLCTKVERTNVSRDVEQQLRRFFGTLVFKTSIPKNIAVEEAHSRHTHVFDHSAKSGGALAYKALVQEVIAR